MGKPNKFDDAVNAERAKSRGEVVNTPTTEEHNQSLTVTSDVASQIRKVSKEDIAREFEDDLRRGDFEIAPQLYSLRAGEVIEGDLEEGPLAEFVDERTTEKRLTRTWIITMRNRARVSILSSAQLDRKVPSFVGGFVKICRGEDVRAGRNIMTEYLVGGVRAKTPVQLAHPLGSVKGDPGYRGPSDAA